MTLRTVDDINDDNAPTPIANRYQHIANLGEFCVIFAAGLGLSFAALHNRSLEIVLGVSYLIAVVYLVLTADTAPRAALFRGVAVTLGVVLGFREIFLLFPLPIIHAVFSVVGGFFLCLRGIKWIRGML
jgi:hypothetical protein